MQELPNLAGDPSAGPLLAVSMDGFSNTGLRVGGNVTMKVPTSADQIASTFVRNVFTVAPIQITMGARMDRVFLGETRIGSSVKVDLGAGADQFDFDIDALVPGSTVVGPVTVLGGTGADVFTISESNVSTNGIEFRNRVLIDGGADSDT